MLRSGSRCLFRSFLKNRDGNFVILFALMLPATLFIVGMTIDYSRAARLRTALNAAADAAVLAAVTPAMMQQPPAVGEAAATNMFNAIADSLNGLVPGATSVTVTISNPGGNLLQRSVTVEYVAESENIFAGILKTPFLGLHGTSTSAAESPPNIDFTLLLDNSPSMALPATAAGINTMVALTAPQDGGNGCALACHQASTGNSDTQGNPYVVPGTLNVCNTAGADCVQADNFTVARLNNITLRVDEMTSAVTELLETAWNTENNPNLPNQPNYRFTINEMNSTYAVGFNTIVPQGTRSSFVSDWAAKASSFQLMEMFTNGYSCVATGGNPCGAGNSANDDMDTSFDDALSNQLAQLPVAGQGTNTPGDTPQQVLFWVTDGVEDEDELGHRIIQSLNANGAHNYCDDIKAKGVKIAILYTTYLPILSNSFYVDNVAPFQPNIGPALQACASSPDLYIQAQIGEDIGQDLTRLFEAVVQGSHLTD